MAHASSPLARLNAPKTKSGVYVDVCTKPNKRALGIVVIIDHKQVRRIYVPFEGYKGTSLTMEFLACIYAKILFPSRTVYTDNKEAAKRSGAAWIPRSLNGYAHMLARGTLMKQHGLEVHEFPLALIWYGKGKLAPLGNVIRRPLESLV